MSTQARARARGVALIAVLWLVAAMSLVISGVVQSVRSEMRTIGSYRQTVLANAAGDAAILMALQSLHASQQEPKNSIQVIPVQFEGQSYAVRIHPLNGLIDVNHAPVTLLAQLYRHAGGLNPEAAQALAQATIVAVTPEPRKVSAMAFRTVLTQLKTFSKCRIWAMRSMLNCPA